MATILFQQDAGDEVGGLLCVGLNWSMMVVEGEAVVSTILDEEERIWSEC